MDNKKHSEEAIMEVLGLIIAYVIGGGLGFYITYREMKKDSIIVKTDNQFSIEQTISITYKTKNITTSINPN